MKNLFAILLGLLVLPSLGQDNTPVDLDWKIGKNEKVSYLTVMSDIDTSSFEINMGGLFKAFSDSSGNGLSEAKDFFKKLNASFKNVDMVTDLTNNDKGIIDITMSTRPKEESESKERKKEKKNSDEKDFAKLMQSLNQGVMLRGSVYPTGEIQSFWVKSSQKNLIALFFELPFKPVKIGDSWHLDIDLIANDQNFKCDSSYKLNKVTLTDIKKVNGESIAVLKYDIVEYVKGIFSTPSFMGMEGGEQETMLKFTHQAIGEFSIDKGRWISYDGIMTMDASGVMTAQKKTKFTLIPDSGNKSR